MVANLFWCGGMQRVGCYHKVIFCTSIANGLDMSHDAILDKVGKYYTGKLREFGPTPRGVDWNSAELQQMRFAQLLRFVPAGRKISINDYGCGYGGLLDFLGVHGYLVDYVGFEISTSMIAEARRLHPNNRFVNAKSELPVSEYTVASGVFNVRLGTCEIEWREYICAELRSMREHSSAGFAFNILTSYSDPERQRPDLYYADPLFFFDYCKRNFSPYVTLFHDYPLYEFTLAVRI